MLSLYIHWPFCKSKCPYCDFNSHLFDYIDYQKWYKSYIKELDYFYEHIKDKEISSIFFGGGTPSLMPAYLVEDILSYISNKYKLSNNVEISLEANPTSIETDTFGDLYNAGINRFSIGIQSFNQSDLKFLGREHNVDEAKNALRKVAKITDNYSFDLIYARPNQSINDWKNELSEALKYSANHISLYQLTIEKGTAFYKDFLNNKFIMPDEELSADLYDLTQEITNKYNLIAYETSNHAKKGYECKHNLNYWKYNEYLGIGPGAHSRLEINNDLYEIMMIHNPNKWLDNIASKSNGIQRKSAINYQDKIAEFFMMGLRLKEGISNNQCKLRLGKNISDILNKEEITYLKNNNLIIIDHEHIKTTEKGSKLVNYITGRLFS